MVKIRTLSDLRGLFVEVMRLPAEDAWVVDFFVSVALASRWGRDCVQPWASVVTRSGGGKSEVLQTLLGIPWVEPFDDLTPKAFSSAFISEDDSEKDMSLLPKLDRKLVLMTDFASIRSKPTIENKKIMGDLCKIFDGQFRRATGVGERDHKCHFGLIIASVPELDTFMARSQILGTRFISFRVFRKPFSVKDRELAFLDHVDGSRYDKPTWRRMLKRQTHKFIKRAVQRFDVDGVPPRLARKKRHKKALLEMVWVVSRLRCWNPKTGTADMEIGTRIIQQISNLITARILADGRNRWTDDDMAFAARIAVDCVWPPAIDLIRILYKQNGPVGATDLSREIHLPLTTVRNLLRQYLVSGVCEARSHSSSTVTLHPWAREALELSGMLEQLP